MDFVNASKNSKSSASATSKVSVQIEESLRLTEEAQTRGLSALNNLQTQEENLDGARRTMEANEYTLAKTQKVLRGMTWSGAIYNMFASDPTPTSVASAGASSSMTSTSSRSNGAQGSGSRTENRQVPIEALGPWQGDTAAEEGMDPMHGVLKGVEALHDMSLSLGQKIQANNDKIQDTERVLQSNEDQLLKATLRTAQLTQRNTRSVETLVGTFQFIHTPTGRYLAVADASDDLVLQDPVTGSGGEPVDRASLFFIYKKEQLLMGALNAKTHKWIGTTWLGDIKASGERFGRNEELYVDITGRPSGVYVLACNWYSGGWIRTPPVAEEPVTSMLRPSSGIDDKEGCILLEAKPWGDTHKLTNVKKQEGR